MKTRVIRRLGRSLLLGAFLLPASAGAQHFPPADDLELMLRYLVEDGETPGVVLAVLDEDGSTSVVAYGTPGPDALPLGPRSVFEIGSLTMTFTATLLAEMAARGEVSLDDPVSRYLPEDVTVPSVSGREITLRHLATHSARLPPGPSDPYADISVEELYEILSAHELDGAPGRGHELSKLGYGLLGLALSRAAGMPFPDLLRERVLDPLGMDMTGYGMDGEVGEWMTRGHEDGEVVPYSSATDALQGATGLRSNAIDLLAFLNANAGAPGTDLERAMKVAQEVRFPGDGGEGNGFSWRTYTVARQPLLVTHGGRTGGFTSLVSFDPERGIGTVLLANTRWFNDWTARDLLYPDAPSSKGRAEVDPAVLERYAGTYDSMVGKYKADLDQGKYFIRLEDEGYLTYQRPGLIRTRLYAESDSSFYMLRGPFTVTFDRAGDDTRMMIRVDERESEFRGGSWTAWKVSDETPASAVAAKNASVWAMWGRGTWALIGLLGVAGVAVVARPIWSGRSRAA